jgi:hypothetical protein
MGTGLRAWVDVVSLEALIGTYYYALFEVMNTSNYIETELAGKIRKAFPDLSEFWGYERYKQGNRVYSPSDMYLVMLFCLLPPYLALLFFRPWHRERIDYGFTIISIVVACFVFRIARKTVSLQKRFAP